MSKKKGLVFPEPSSDLIISKEYNKDSIPDDGRNGDIINECDYDAGLTKLYSYIESKKWDDALQQIAFSPHETSIWVYRKHRNNGKIRWRLLPIHAAIIFNAPEEVIELLLLKNPQGAQSKDDQGALPLHLAIRNKRSEVIVTLLLMAYPRSIELRDRKNRLPSTLAQSISNSVLKNAYMSALQNVSSYFKITQVTIASTAVNSIGRKAEEERPDLIKKDEEAYNKHVNQLEMQGYLASAALQSVERKPKTGAEKTEMFDTELANIKDHAIVVDNHCNQIDVQAALDSTKIQSTARKAEAQRLSLTENIETLETELARAKKHETVVKNRINQLEVKFNSSANNKRLLTAKITTLDMKARSINQLKDSQKMEFTTRNKKLQKEKIEVEEFAKTVVNEISNLRDTVSKQHTTIGNQRDVNECVRAKIESLKKDLANLMAQSAAIKTKLKPKINDEQIYTDEIFCTLLDST